MRFFRLLATENLGFKNDVLREKAVSYGAGCVAVGVNAHNGNLVIQDVTQRSVSRGFNIDVGLISPLKHQQIAINKSVGYDAMLEMLSQ